MAKPNAEVAAAFTQATLVALAELAGIEVDLAEDAKIASAAPAADLYAALALRKKPPGVLLCCFPAAVAQSLARRILPPLQFVTPELAEDAIGELANVIAGQAKTALKDTSHHFQLSTPTTFREARPPQLNEECGIELQFAGVDGVFWLWIGLPTSVPCKMNDNSGPKQSPDGP